MIRRYIYGSLLECWNNDAMYSRHWRENLNKGEGCCFGSFSHYRSTVQRSIRSNNWSLYI
jgi:hypothetical protein